MSNCVAPVSGFISQKLTDPVPVHENAPREVNAGYKWHHSTWAFLGERLSKDMRGAIPGQGLSLDGVALSKGNERARDHVLPMLNFKNAVTLAKLVNTVATDESRGSKDPTPWRVVDVCPIHGTTTAAFFEHFTAPLNGLHWCPSTVKALHQFTGKEEPVRPEFDPATNDGQLRSVYWPSLAALHGHVVADAVMSKMAYVRAYPDLEKSLAGKNGKLLQGSALEKRASQPDIAKKHEITHQRRISFEELNKKRRAVEELLTGEVKVDGGGDVQSAIGANLRFIVEALLTRQYSEQHVVQLITWICSISATIALLPHGVDTPSNRSSEVAMKQIVAELEKKDATRGKLIHEYRWKATEKNFLNGTNQAVHVTLDWDVHSEHARYNLWYLARGFDSISLGNKRDVSMLSFVLPRQFRTMKVDFSRRCSLSNYLFHHLRYFDANASDSEDAIKAFHSWSSAKRFDEVFRQLFCEGKHVEVQNAFETRVNAWASDENKRVTYAIDQGPLRFVIVYRPSRYTSALANLSSELIRIVTPGESAAVTNLPVLHSKDVAPGPSAEVIGDAVNTRDIFEVMHRVFNYGTPDPKLGARGSVLRNRGLIMALRDALFFAYNPSNKHSAEAKAMALRFDELQGLYKKFNEKRQTEKYPVLDPQFVEISWRLTEQILDARTALATALPERLRVESKSAGRLKNKSTHGGFWRVDTHGGRDRMNLAPHPLYKFKGRVPVINLDELAFDLPSTSSSIYLETGTAEQARRMALMYRAYVYRQRVINRKEPYLQTPSTFLDGIRDDRNRAVLSYMNTLRLARACAHVLSPLFTKDTAELKGKMEKSWGIAIAESGEHKGQKREGLTPLWVVFQPGYGSATLALHESGFRVIELSQEDDFHERDYSTEESKRGVPAPKYSIGVLARDNIPTGRTALTRMAILTHATEAVVEADTEYTGPLAMSSRSRIKSLFLSPLTKDGEALTGNVQRLLEHESSSFVLFHLRISNYDLMAAQRVAPEFNKEDSYLLTKLVEHVCRQRIRKVIVVPVPTEDRGKCNPFFGTVRVPEGSLKCIRVRMQSLDALFIFTWMFNNDSDVHTTRARLAAEFSN